METCSVKNLRSSGIVPLNRENAIDFANLLYSKSKGSVEYVKLCNGYLVDTLDFGVQNKKLHCAIGEAYFRFVSHNMKSVTAVDKFTLNKPFKLYTSDLGIELDGSTAKAIDKLVEKAVLKNSTPENKQRLAQAFSDCVDANDNTNLHSLTKKDQKNSLINEGQENYTQETIYQKRAEKVAKIWRQEVVPLLK